MSLEEQERRDSTTVQVRPRAEWWLIAILVASVLLRVGVALYLGDVVDAPALLTDQRSYHALGARLIGGHGFSFDRGWYPFTPAETPTAHWSFLYSLFVAGVYAIFGVHPLAARLVQAVLGGILLPWSVFRLTRRVFETGTPDPGATQQGAVPKLVPYVAAAIAAIYGYFVLYAATLMTETFYIAAVLWSLEMGLAIVSRLRHGEAPDLRTGVWLGLVLGITALLRQSILPWVPVFFVYVLWMALQTHQLVPAFKSLALAGAVMMLCILPWTYRNYRAFGEFLLLNSNTGYAMYSAQHPMHGTQFREFDAAPLPEDLMWGNEAAMDRELMRLGMQFVIDEPGRYLLLTLSRVRAFFEFWPTRDTSLLHNVGRVASYGLFLPFMLYGFVLAATGAFNGMRADAASSPSAARFFRRNGLLLLFGLVYTGVHLLTWAMVRYRLPIDAVMFSFAALALVELYRRLSQALAHSRPAVVATERGRQTLLRHRSEEGEWH